MTTAVVTTQPDFFGLAEVLPPGLQFEPQFIDAAAERALLEVAAALPLQQARFKIYTARRRVHHFAPDALPPALQSLRDRLAAWAGIDGADFVHAMVSEYRAGTPLGWHRDAPQYELIVGVSFGGHARLRLRPWPAVDPKKDDIVALDLVPRSAYLMRGPARWAWQHSVPPVPGLRYSVTMRTARALQ